MDPIQKKLQEAQLGGLILASTRENVRMWLNPDLFEPWVLKSIAQLVEGEHWSELNDRFYKTLSFGTGGLRGRTVGNVVTDAEWEGKPASPPPPHPAVGSNCMNDFNVRRVTMGLVAYIRQAGPIGPKPHVIFAHDTRYFSRHFAELAARTVIELGGLARLFDSERSTPELSFAVRHQNADAGVVITASHNPPYDNGFKAYYADGAQVVEPHASGIIGKVHAVSIEDVCRKPAGVVENFQILPAEVDRAYKERLLSLVLEPEILKKESGRLKVVYSALHGTGAKMVPQVLEELGLELITVPEQMRPDGRFPTVQSPNPENAEALALSIQLADRERADVVLATDPDADRMGVAVRNEQGKMELLTGNQIGSLLGHYRLERFFEHGVLNDKNREHACLIKTVVTTDLQKSIAQKFHVAIPETLTGFKYIGAKLCHYEEKTLKESGVSWQEYRALSEPRKRELQLKHGCYYVFGGEESYGYSAADYCRDKDANAACVMFAELAAFAKSHGQTVIDYLNGIYAELGYYQEKLGQLVFEGADGAAKIQKILQSIQANPPKEILGLKVSRIQNYAKEDIRDMEGELLPKELLIFMELSNGARFAVRGSGTEPKIKYYMFAHEKPAAGKIFTKLELSAAKTRISSFLGSLWNTIEKDAHVRAEK